MTDNTPGIQLLNPSNVGCGTDSSGATVAPCTAAPSFNTQLRHPDIAIGSVVLGGSHVLTTTWFNWELSAGRAFDKDTGTSTSFSNTLSSSGCQYDPVNTSNVYLPRWNAQCYNEAYNPANMVMSEIDGNAGHTAQLNLQVAAAGAKRYHIGSRSAIIEIGGKFRNEHKFADTYNLTYTPNNTILLSSFPNRLTNTNYYNGGNYRLGYNADQEDINAFLKANLSGFTVSSTFGQDPSYFGLVEQIGAGYVMNTIDLSPRLRFIAGIRVETTSDRVNNFAVGNYPCAPPESGTCRSISPNEFSGNYVTVLPSTSLRYALDSNSYLRFVYARGLSRPDPQDIAQTLSWSVAGNGANRYSVSFGNAGLKAETGDDIDLLYDHYLNSFGVVSAGFFYKNLQNPIITRTYELDNYQPPGGPLSNYLATQPVNAGSAWVTGFEAAYLQHFTFLPGIWAGLGLSANYGHTASRTSGIPGRSDNPPLLRTSPNAFNISPTYDRGRLSLRVGVSYNQASIYGYQYTDGMPGGVNGPLSDIYFYSHIQVDAQASIRMTHGLTFVVYGLNLNNAVFGFYQGAPQYMIQREYYQPTVAAGFRWTPMPTEY